MTTNLQGILSVYWIIKCQFEAKPAKKKNQLTISGHQSRQVEETRQKLVEQEQAIHEEYHATQMRLINRRKELQQELAEIEEAVILSEHDYAVNLRNIKQEIEDYDDTLLFLSLDIDQTGMTPGNYCYIDC